MGTFPQDLRSIAPALLGVLLRKPLLVLSATALLSVPNPAQTQSQSPARKSSSRPERRPSPELAAQLPVTRVSLYKNGVGFFEHAGRVTGDEAVTHRLHHRAAQRRPPVAHRHRPRRRPHLRRGLQLHHAARAAAQVPSARARRRPRRRTTSTTPSAAPASKFARQAPRSQAGCSPSRSAPHQDPRKTCLPPKSTSSP